MELPTGKNGYFVLDGTGSVVALIDGQGNLETTYTYGPYGEPWDTTGTGPLADANPYRHHTGLYDPSTGYLKHGTRWNDTDSGRWTTVDPITRLTDPNQANPYEYAGCNPTNNIDPTGQFSLLGEILAGVTGATVATTCIAIGVLATGGVGFVASPLLVAGCDLLGFAAGVAYSYAYEQNNG
jgi:RHS repeat-associated protein